MRQTIASDNSKLPADNSRYRLTLLFLGLIIYITLVTIAILTLATILPTEYPKRISLAVRYSFPTTINNFAFPVAILLAIILIIIFRKVYGNLLVNTRRLALTCRALEPTLFIYGFFTVKYTINKVHIDGMYSRSILHFGYGLLQDDFLRLLLNLNISLFSVFFLASYRRTMVEKSDMTHLKTQLIGWLVPISLIVSESSLNLVESLVSYKVLENYLILQLIVILVIKGIFVFAFFWIMQNCKERQILFAFSAIMFIIINTIFLSRIPTKLFSWRPQYSEIVIDPKPFVWASVIVSLLAIKFVWAKRELNNTSVSMIIGAIVFSFATRVDSVVIPTLDNHHYSGENFGNWYNITHNNLVPYRDFELHRGLLVNFIPSFVANALSPGNPELYSFTHLIYAFILGMFLVGIISRWISTNLAICIVLILPRPNGYVEIDYLNFAIVLLFTYLVFRKPRFNYLLPTLIALSTFLILLAPGQGIVATFMLIIIYLYGKRDWGSIKLLYSSSKSPKYYALLLVSVIFGALSTYMTFPASIWIIRTSSANADMYGDGWIPKALFGEHFPTNLRWLIFPFVFSLILYIFNIRRYIDSRNFILLTVTVIYFLLISNRWLGRVDQDTFSRIGQGFMSILGILIIPILLSLKREMLFTWITVSLFILIASYQTSLDLFPKIANRFERASIGELNSSNVLRGEEYALAKDLIHRHFGVDSKGVNLTGGNASDFYMGLNSVGGVQTPYMVVNDDQELSWISRIESVQPDFFFGPYGGLGGIEADDTTLFARVPAFSWWLIKNNQIVKCDDITFLIPNRNWTSRRDSFVNDKRCQVPQDEQSQVNLWNEMNGKVDHFGNALINWGEVNFSNIDFIDRKTISIRKQDSFDINFSVKCNQGTANSRIILRSYLGKTLAAETSFKAALGSGVMGFDRRMFPILNLNSSKYTLTIENPDCSIQQTE